MRAVRRHRAMINVLKKWAESHEEILLAYLFGSFARGEENRLSDIDIAVLVSDRANGLSKIKVKYIDELASILKIDDIDVLILNNAPPYLKFAVVREGILLKGKQSIRIKFEEQTVIEYLDTKPLRDIWARKALEGILDET